MSSKKIRCIAKAVGIVGNPLGNTVTLREAKCCFKAADEEYWQLKIASPNEVQGDPLGPLSR